MVRWWIIYFISNSRAWKIDGFQTDGGQIGMPFNLNLLDHYTIQRHGRLCIHEVGNGYKVDKMC